MFVDSEGGGEVDEEIVLDVMSINEKCLCVRTMLEAI